MRKRQSQAKAERHHKTMQALQLRASGATYRQIADVLGVSEPTAWRLVQQETQSIIRESAAEVLELELTRLDRMQMAVWPEAIQGDHAAIDAVLRIMHHRARLLGLYDRAGQQQDAYPQGAIIIPGECSSSEYINALRAIRGELPPPSNGNGHHTGDLDLDAGS
jgi:Homeodomain-like domain